MPFTPTIIIVSGALSAAARGIPPDEPLVERIDEACGIYFRSVFLKQAGTLLPQHTHDHDHATLVCAGKARCWANDLLVGDKEAGEAFEIKAGVRHVFMALEPNTRLACVHNIESAESVKAKGL